MPELKTVIESHQKSVPIEATVIDQDKPAKKPPVKKPVVAKTEVKPKVEEVVEVDEVKEEKYVRPPIEQIVRDFDTLIESRDINDKKIKKLGYKCGKIIFGLENESGKDFRVAAYKARKKTKSVSGKSRCIFYFGLSKDSKSIIKSITGASISKMGKCSVQSAEPVELVLDKITFSDVFNKDLSKVMESLTKLTNLAVEHKSNEFKTSKEKKETETKE